MTASLLELRAEPFELLVELDRRLRALRADLAGGGTEVWQGLAFRSGSRWMVAPKADVGEVIQPPRVTRVPHGRPWLSGVANVRGNLLTLIDLGRLFSDQSSEGGRTTRALVLKSDQVSAGFLVDEVAGYRQFTAREQTQPQLAPDDPIAPYLLGGFLREGRAWHVLSLHKLVASETLRRAGW